MAELQIKIAADVNDAIRGLDKVQSELDQTGQSAAALGNTVGKATNSFKGIPQSAGQASMAITNLNRVVQDAPFGFIGIQNNIGPLIDSFGMLKTSTGSTGGAIRALAGSLMGPAGIGLAIAGISSAITFAIQGFSSWTKGLGAAKEASDKLAASVSIDLVKLTSIVGLAQNTAASTQDRAKALQLLNQEYAKYLPNLNQESITLDNINVKYKEIIDSMMRQAVVKGLQQEIAKEVEKTAKQILALQIAQEKERIELDKANKTKYTSLTTDQKLAQIADQKNKAITDGVIAFNKQTQAERAAIGTTNVYDTMIQGLKDSLMQTLAPVLKLSGAFGDLDSTLKKTPKIGKLDFSQFLQMEEVTFPIKFSDDPSDYKDSVSPVAAVLKNEMEAYFKRTEPLDASLLLQLDAEKLKKFSFMGFKGLTEAQKDMADTAAEIGRAHV